jgi:hypothetical protein
MKVSMAEAICASDKPFSFMTAARAGFQAYHRERTGRRSAGIASVDTGRDAFNFRQASEGDFMKGDPKKSGTGSSKIATSKSTAKKSLSKRTPRDSARAAMPVAADAEEKRVHGRFSFPESDYELIAQLKSLAKKNGRLVKKNELLRAGLRSLRALHEEEFIAALALFKFSKVKRSAAAKGD